MQRVEFATFQAATNAAQGIVVSTSDTVSLLPTLALSLPVVVVISSLILTCPVML
jgi:hypothetical protein